MSERERERERERGCVCVCVEWEHGYYWLIIHNSICEFKISSDKIKEHIIRSKQQIHTHTHIWMIK